jgi:hypothetical protein
MTIVNFYQVVNLKHYKTKENKKMGITCKPVGGVRSIMRKMENELERQKKEVKKKKDGGRDSESK